MNSFWPPFKIRVGLNGDPVPAQPPVNTAPPVATGTPQVGETLTATAGLWSGAAPIEVTQRWLWSDDGETWTGYPPARGTSSITLDEDDIGRLIAPNVRAQNAAGQSGWVRGVALGPVVAADEPVEPGEFARTASTNSTRTIHSGHSLTDAYVHGGPYPGTIRLIVESIGITDAGNKIAKSTIPGSPLHWRWDHDGELIEGERAVSDIDQFHTLMITEGGPPPQTTSGGMVGTLDYLCRFTANTIENGAGNEVILWSIWPSLFGPGASAENPIPSGDWAGYTFRSGLPEYENSFKYMADYATWKMHQLYPSLPEDWRVWLFPGHKWMERVYDDIQNDLVPGITDIWDMFGDDIHPSYAAGYGLSCLVTTCLYQVNLTEAENVWIQPEFENHDGPHPAVPQALAEYFWQIAWEIATAYEPVGMGGTEGAALRWQPSDGDPMPNWTLANPNTGGGGGDPDPDPQPGDMPETVILVNNDGSPYSGPPKFDSKTAKRLISLRRISPLCDYGTALRQVLAGSGC